MSPDRLIERLERGDRIMIARPASVARVIEVVAAKAQDQPEGSLEVRFRYLDGPEAGSAGWTFARPLDRVRLAP